MPKDESFEEIKADRRALTTENHDLWREVEQLREALKECQAMLEIAFDYDGDVFGKSHNRAVDANLVARAALKDKDNG
jgi:regulator of replication initiation timing